MGRVRHSRCAAAALAVALLTGCSPAVDPGADPSRDPFSQPVVPTDPAGSTPGGSGAAQQSGVVAEPRRGSGVVTAVVEQGRTLPEDVVRDFRSTTGFALRQVEVPAGDLHEGAPQGTDADVILGLDANAALEATSAGVLATTAPQDTTTPTGTALQGAPAATAYARDDVCLLADTQWFAANRKELPTSWSELASGGWPDLLLVPDPAGSVEGLAFTAAAQASLGSGVDAWWSALTAGGVESGTPTQILRRWTASSGTGTDARPLLVARQSVVATTLNDSGTESASAAVGATCLERMLYSAVTADATHEDGAESLLAYLRGTTVQEVLASTGVAFPLSATDAEGTAIGWFSQPSADALQLPEADLPSADARAETWSKGLE